MDEEINYDKKFMDDFYRNFPEINKEFKKHLVEKQYFDFKRDAKKYFSQMCGLSDYILFLFEQKEEMKLQRILLFIENSIGQNKETDESIEVFIFEDIINVLRGRDSDNGTHSMTEFEKLLGQRSINLCRKNEVLWNSLDREPKSLANMIRFLKEQDN
ncbi:hypothetical protein Cva_00215 [Caedimonas varicaedens]|uniref:DUF7674 domain-containing protein n=1 Tax=Caedimonas varicaedens TaxID=1629334 RepID=A0A0K8MCH2_9PROT|nr:hypothetical protein Cva_00215 [Caedimonas varicaedens]